MCIKLQILQYGKIIHLKIIKVLQNTAPTNPSNTTLFNLLHKKNKNT